VVLYPQKIGKLDIEPLSMDIDVQPSNRRDVFGRMVLTEDNKGYLLEQNHNGESFRKRQTRRFSGAVGNLILKLHNKTSLKTGKALI
jgi:hypothetical protein